MNKTIILAALLVISGQTYGWGTINTQTTATNNTATGRTNVTATTNGSASATVGGSVSSSTSTGTKATQFGSFTINGRTQTKSSISAYEYEEEEF